MAYFHGEDKQEESLFMSTKTKPQLIKFYQTAPINFTILKKKSFFFNFNKLLYWTITLLNNHSRKMLFDTWKHICYLINSVSHVENKIQQNISFCFFISLTSFGWFNYAHSFCQFKWMKKQASGQRKLPAQGWNLLVPGDWKIFFKCWVCNSDHSPSWQLQCQSSLVSNPKCEMREGLHITLKNFQIHENSCITYCHLQSSIFSLF